MLLIVYLSSRLRYTFFAYVKQVVKVLGEYFIKGFHMKLSFYCSVVFVSFLSFSTFFSIDLPVFYRALMHQGFPECEVKNWTGRIFVGGGYGSTSRGWNCKKRKTELLGIHGPVDIVRLGLGVEKPGTRTAELWKQVFDPDSEGGYVDLFNNMLVDECDGGRVGLDDLAVES